MPLAMQVADDVRGSHFIAVAAPPPVMGCTVELSRAVGADSPSVVLPPASYTAFDCAGKTLIVVASDAAAQSDLYIAVTQACVVETDRVVLAGRRVRVSCHASTLRSDG